MVSGYDTDEITRPIALQNERLEDALDILAQLFGHMLRREVFLIDGIGDQFIGNLRPVEQACGIRLFNLSVCHDLS